MAKAKGYMKKIWKNIKSTNTPDTPPTEDKPMETFKTRYNHVFSNIIDPQQYIATNLTGQFMVTSSRVNKY